MALRRDTMVTGSANEEVAVVDQVAVRDQVFDLSRVTSLLAGAFFVVMGALVLLDTGFDGFPDLPLSTTFGFTQTPLVGALGLGLGLLLLAGGSGWDRSTTTFVSALMAIAGLIVVFGTDRLPEALVTDKSYGVLLLVVGVGLLLVATVVPAVRSQRRVDRTSTRS